MCKVYCKTLGKLASKKKSHQQGATDPQVRAQKCWETDAYCSCFLAFKNDFLTRDEM